jgi:hypothetical protein
MKVDLDQFFTAGKKPIIAIALAGLVADIVANTEYVNYSVMVLPVELAILAYFAHMHAKKADLLDNIAATVLVANAALVINAALYLVLLLAGMAAGMLPQAPAETIAVSVGQSFVIAVVVFSIMASIAGAAMWAVKRLKR